MFYCMFYFTCDRSLSLRVYSTVPQAGGLKCLLLSIHAAYVKIKCYYCELIDPSNNTAALKI